MSDAARRRARARLAAWMKGTGRAPALFQRAVWNAWERGESGLLIAPTGVGKTLAVLGGSLIDAQDNSARGLRMLWITPLRALAGDTQRQVGEAAAGLGLNWRVLRRTGDSGSGERARVARGAVELLITTPESLALMLSHPDLVQRLERLDTVVVDEWHELLGNKRGTLLELGLSRLRALRPQLRVWGLSATLGNPHQAMAHLLGSQATGTLIDVPRRRRPEVSTALPALRQRFPWGGHLGLAQLPRVLAAIESARSTLVFTNTRSQAELWHQALASVWTGEPGEIAIHHGSLDRTTRAQVEAALAARELRCVVATSSLDLGVDFPAVDQSIQIGSPRSVARALQRAGRSGHRPGARSRLLMVPTHNLEIAEAAALRRSIGADLVEPREPPTRCLDVLAQHLVTLATGGGFEADTTFDEVRTARAFHDLQRSDFDRVIVFITRGGDALERYPQFQRVVEDAGRYRIASPAHARLQRFSIGTIAGDASVRVASVRGRVFGEVEESFVARLRIGDRFRFGGRTLELVRLRDLTAQVRTTTRTATTVPRWQGGRLPLSGTLSAATRRELATPDFRMPEMRALKPMIERQRETSLLPADDELLVESIRLREGRFWFLYPFAGRLAHEGLAAIIAARLASRSPIAIGYALNDYGLMLGGRGLPEPDELLLRELLDPSGLDIALANSVNLSELARRKFRDIARVAGLLMPSRPGAPRSLRQLQASSGLLFDVLSEHDPEHLLLQQARHEVQEDMLEMNRLRRALASVRAGAIVLSTPRTLTPFAFPLWAERLRAHLGHEDWKVKLARLAQELEAA